MPLSSELAIVFTGFSIGSLNEIFVPFSNSDSKLIEPPKFSTNF